MAGGVDGYALRYTPSHCHFPLPSVPRISHDSRAVLGEAFGDHPYGRDAR
jgi:hypothetical protein